MTDLISLAIRFTHRTYKFQVPPTMDVDEIRCKVGRYFHIDMNRALLEIYDRRFELYVILNDEYLGKMRKNINMAENKSFSGRVCFLDQSSYDSEYDTIESDMLFSETSKTFVSEASS